MTKVFPIILMVLNICAAIIYIKSGEYWKGYYWLSAFQISLAVYFMKQ